MGAARATELTPCRWHMGCEKRAHNLLLVTAWFDKMGDCELLALRQTIGLRHRLTRSEQPGQAGCEVSRLADIMLQRTPVLVIIRSLARFRPWESRRDALVRLSDGQGVARG